MNDDDLKEDPNKPFSVARVAVWALGIIGLVAVVGLVLRGLEDQVSASLRGVVQTAVGALAAVTAARSGK